MPNGAEPQLPGLLLGKRRRDAEDSANDGGGQAPNRLFIPDENDIVPEDGAASEDEPQANERNIDVEDEETDDDIDDNEDGRVVYDPTLEPFPECAVYDKTISNIKEDFIKIPQKVFEFLHQQECDTGHFNLHKEAAANLLAIPSPEKKLKIALLGDAGAGKSSVLNSITDIPDLAKSLSGGQSCTCVPTEYTGAFPRQQKAFAAYISYFKIDEIRALLVELLQDYNNYAFEQDEDWDQDTLTAFKRKMLNAMKIFSTLFCDVAEFKDQQAAMKNLKEAYDEGSEKLMTMMMESVEAKLKDKLGPTGYYSYHEAGTRTRLRDIIDPLVTLGVSPEQPALWPLVKLVMIGVRSARVLENLTIIDLPGISDTNELRVNLTKEHVRHCDHLWIVANISRVVDDGMVDSLISKYSRRFEGKIAIICTHADDGIDSKLVRHLRDHGQDLTEYRELSEQFRVQKLAATELNAGIKKGWKRSKHTKNVLYDLEKQAKELKGLQARLVSLENSKLGLLVKARNTLISAQLRCGLKFHNASGADLKVFCVSNLHYAAAKGQARLRGSRLEGVLTGIPALRKYALTLPASKLMETIDNYGRNSLLVYLKDVALWVNQTSVERRQDLMAIVQQLPQKLSERVADRRMQFKEDFEAFLSTPMREQQPAAIAAAVRVHAQKSKKHPSTIRAFVKKNGLHSTKLCPKESWNEQFSRVLIDFTTTQWPEWENELMQIEARFEEGCLEDLQAVIATFRAHPCAGLLPIDRLAEFVDANASSVQRALKSKGEAYKHDLSNQLLDITLHSDTNHFSRAIQAVYNECNADRGKGVVGRCMDRLKAYLQDKTDKSPFAITTEDATPALLNTDTKHVNAQEKAIRNIFQRTIESFDRAIDRKLDDAAEKQVRERLKKNLSNYDTEYAKVCASLEALEAKYAI